MADLLMKMASNQKMQENKATLKFNFTIEKKATSFKIIILTFSPSPTESDRCHQVATLVGKIYACGGDDGSSFLRYVECFDPVTSKCVVLILKI